MSFTFKEDGDDLALTCDDCGGHVCAIEEGDDLEIITRTALDHADECEAAASTSQHGKAS